jgi:Family of unknown function (DUF6530)
MTWNEFGNERQFVPDDELPLNLDHKPVYAMPYQHFDGIYITHGDARYLSVGLAQWRNNDLSLKIMRHTGEKWSRQAEELPLHRVLDAAIFLSKVLLDNETDRIEIERRSFENQDAAIQIIKESLNKEENEIFDNYLNNNMVLLKRRLNSLYYALDSLKKKRKFKNFYRNFGITQRKEVSLCKRSLMHKIS